MKTLNKAAILVLLLSNCISLHSQVPQTNLNQFGLLKQFIGTWRCDIASDTVSFYNAELYGTGFKGNYKYVTKDETIGEGKYLLGHDKASEKFIYAIITLNKDIEFWAIWFTSKNKYILIPYSDISNPDHASVKITGEFKSPDMYVATTLVNNKSVKTDTYIRVIDVKEFPEGSRQNPKRNFPPEI